MVEWDLGNVVRAARIRQRLTQEELGRRIGVSKDGISRFERGQASLSLEHGARLAQALDLPVRVFLQRLADARGERAMLAEMLEKTGSVEQQQADGDRREEDQPDDVLDALQPAGIARRRSRRSVIERQIDLRDLRITVRLSLAPPSFLEIEVAPAHGR